ncbi:MAG: sigma 54-interacting transcriptional regulator [Saprospiraceae bacterium]|nr:sigma 54-interacting transcriptional regulator [Saprospiraceae bacterium]
MLHKDIKNFGQLKKSGYVSRSIKEEVRENLIKKWENGEKVFEGIIGFEDTVLPDVERAILSRHNILLLGLRGQAKTRIARLMIQLLDEYMPAIDGVEMDEDPFFPISNAARKMLEEMADNTPVRWIHRSERYVEKLATPDVTVADLIGDIDPIKAANLKVSYADDKAIHYGLIPRAHRSIFVINELPDLQPRIQVALFNILQEGDIQIRGFKMRLPLDIFFVFTANPEDYTNRGSIITPLKDRIESQILTHYPRTLEEAKKITSLESRVHPDQEKTVKILDIHKTILEWISFEARESDYVDDKSGVSARLSLSAYENLISTAERRRIKNKEKTTTTRLTDFWGVVPAITGKVELLYEGEQEGLYNVAMSFIFGAAQKLFNELFPNPEKKLKREIRDEYGVVKAWFAGGNYIELLNDATDKEYKHVLQQIKGLDALVEPVSKDPDEILALKELIIFGLSESEVISKNIVDKKVHFSDPLSHMLDDLDEE